MKIGRQAIADIKVVNDDKIDNIKYIEKLMDETVKEANLHVVDKIIYKFKPIGISAVYILAESHFTLHTWPEKNYVAVDIFTCGETINPSKDCEIISKKFNSKEYNIKEIERCNNEL